MANQIKLVKTGTFDSAWMNTEVVADGAAGCDYPVMSKGIAKAIADKKAANVAASEATDVAGCVTSINAILTALKTAGLMEADA